MNLQIHKTDKIKRYFIFFISLILCFWPFMAFHELGHLTSALINSADIIHVELRPWRLSYTILENSENPLMDVWAGPILGSLFPTVLLIISINLFWKKISLFFCGFCFIANGAYIAAAWLGPYGDGRVMMKFGTPVWIMIVSGVLLLITGFFLWYLCDKIQIKKPGT